MTWKIQSSIHTSWATPMITTHPFSPQALLCYWLLYPAKTMDFINRTHFAKSAVLKRKISQCGFYWYLQCTVPWSSLYWTKWPPWWSELFLYLYNLPNFLYRLMNKIASEIYIRTHLIPNRLQSKQSVNLLAMLSKRMQKASWSMSHLCDFNLNPKPTYNKLWDVSILFDDTLIIMKSSCAASTNNL